MKKIYKEKNVLDAGFERIEESFQKFNRIYVSFSGGKDSSLLLQMTCLVARQTKRKLDVLFVDLEANYKLTIEHIETVLNDNKDVIQDLYWVCLPLSLRNAVSIIQPNWICWDKKDQNKWVREMPKNSINESNHTWNWFRSGIEFEEFIVLFGEWYSSIHGLSGCMVGIRSDESLNRFRTIFNMKKQTLNDQGWTTRIKNNSHVIDLYNLYPIYDMKVEDVWGAIFHLEFSFNEIYELMYKNGLTVSQQRLCQPYGDDQKNGLNQFKALEYETWEKVINRVNGVNFGNIYCRTSLLGNITSEKPDHLIWQEYTVFLLESIRIYCPELEGHYFKKIKKAMKWWEEKENTSLDSILDQGDPKLEAQRKIPSWRRIARALEKNDFWMKGLSFSATKKDKEELEKLKEKHLLVGDGKIDKDLKLFVERDD